MARLMLSRVSRNIPKWDCRTFPRFPQQLYNCGNNGARDTKGHDPPLNSQSLVMARPSNSK